MKAYVGGSEFTFHNLQALKDFFSLDEVSAEDMVEAEGKHLCVCPYAEDIHNSRVLMWADTAEQLERNYKEACDDI